MTPPGCAITVLARPEEDLVGALEALADAVGARQAEPKLQQREKTAAPSGAVTLPGIGGVVAALLPENGIVVDESITSGRALLAMTRTTPPHDWLANPGGSIGMALPLAVGAAVACPERKVLALEGDGSGMYTLQALWTMAREGLKVTSVVFANRTYNILKGELANVGAGNPGRRALDMLEIGRPDLDWVALARGMGVPAARAETLDDLARLIAAGLASGGPEPGRTAALKLAGARAPAPHDRRFIFRQGSNAPLARGKKDESRWPDNRRRPEHSRGGAMDGARGIALNAKATDSRLFSRPRA